MRAGPAKIRLWQRAALVQIARRCFEPRQLVIIDARKRHDFRVDPGVCIDRCVGVRQLQGEIFRSRKVDGFAESVINRAHHRNLPGANAIAHRHEFSIVFHPQGQVLHGASSARTAWIAGMGHANLGRYLGDLGVLHESDTAFVVQTQKSMESVVHPMHPVQGHQLHAQHIGKKLDLNLDVCRAHGQVV